MLSREPLFDKRRTVVRLVREALALAGRFYRTSDGRGFFFNSVERRLFDLDQRPFAQLLTALSGLSRTEAVFGFVLDVLQAETARSAPEVPVHALAAYDMASGCLAVSDGAGGVWVRERGSAWTCTGNGDAALFLTEPDATGWVPDWSGARGALSWFLAGFLFSSSGDLSREDQQAILLVRLVQEFFPPLRRTRAIPTFLGPQGSGKTSAGRRIGRLLVGPAFEVTGLARDKEDGFIAAVTNQTVAVFDNADSRIPWLEDALATYATGTRHRRRRLYSTNDMVAYDSRALLLLSSRDPRFNRPDVAERILPFRFDRPPTYLPEGPLYDELEARRGAIWAGLLEQLAAAQEALATTQPAPSVVRMADFDSFGWRLSAPLGQTKAWATLIAKIEGAQGAFAAEGDGVVEALRIFVEREGALGPLPVATLFKLTQAIAHDKDLKFPQTVQGFGQRLSNLHRIIELELRVRMVDTRGRGRARSIELRPLATRPPGEAGGDGEDIRQRVFNSQEPLP